MASSHLGAAMTVTKARVQELVDGLPDEVDLEEVMYRLYVLEKIEAGEADVAAGRTLSHEEVAARVHSWRQ